MAALKLNEMEQTLTGNTQLTKILFDCYWLVSWPQSQFTQLQHEQVTGHVAVQEVGSDCHK